MMKRLLMLWLAIAFGGLALVPDEGAAFAR
jgi:hypothetical protein